MKKYKGIILAGGSGTRLYPITIAVCKQLLPIYDKPMIYYPMSVLMLAGIKDILIISTKDDISKFENLFKDGKDLGLNIEYAIQEAPNGLAEAFIIGEKFIGNDNVALILGDNIFFGRGFSEILERTIKRENGATIFAYHVNDPKRYGIVEFDDNKRVLSIEEKPNNPKTNFAVTGLYFYDNQVVDIAKSIKPSDRGELEITDVNKRYLELDNLNVEILGRGFAWLDTGTNDSLIEASLFVETVQKRQSLMVSCLEEIAYYKGFIDKQGILKQAKKFEKSEYGKYLMKLYNMI